MTTRDLVGSLGWTPRTVLRLFLLVAGAGMLAWGLTSGVAFRIGLGGVAMILGVVGLWSETRRTAE